MYISALNNQATYQLDSVLAYVIFLSLATILSLIVAYFALRFRDRPGGLTLGLLMLAVAVWAFASVFEASAVDIALKVFWSKVAYLGTTSVPVLLLTFTLLFTHQKEVLTPRYLAPLWVIPIITLALAITNEWHYLIWNSFTPIPGSNLISYGHGTWFWVQVVYVYLVISITTILIVRAALRSRHVFRQQAFVLLIGIIFPWLANIIYLSNFEPLRGWELTPAAFAITGALLTWSFIRLHFLNLVPVARDKVIENMPDGMVVVNNHNRVADINPAARQLLKLAGTRVIGQQFEQFFSAWPDLVERLNETETDQTEVLLDGIGCIELRTSPLYDRKGYLAGRVITIQDITERKNAEQELKRIKEFNESIVQTVHGAIIVLDAAGLFTFINPAMVDLLGYTPDELIGQHLKTILPPDQYPIVDAAKERMQGGKADRYQVEVLHKDGSRIPVLVSGTPRFDAETGEFIGTVTVQTDIREQVKAEVAEREQRALAEALRDTASILNSTLEIDQILDRILDNVGRVVPHDAVSIMLIENGFARVVRQRGFEAHGLEEWILGIRLNTAETPKLRQLRTTREPILTKDTRADPNWVEFPETRWIRSHMIVPILKAGDPVGMLNLDSETPNYFTVEHIERLQVFADQVSIALENAHLYQEALKAAERRATLHQVSQEIVAASRSPERVYEAIHHATEKLMPCDAFVISTLNGDDRMLEAVYRVDKGERYPPKRSALDGTLSGQVITKGESLLINSDGTASPGAGIHFGDTEQVRSVLAVPLQLNDRAFGMLSAQSYLPDAYTTDDQRLLEMLAAHAAATLENTRLFDRERQRLARLTALHTIDQAISSNTDLESILNVVVEQITSRLNVDAADILLYETPTQTLIYANGHGFHSNTATSVALRVGRGCAGQVALERRTIYIPDVNDEENIEVEYIPSDWKDERFISYVGVPLIAKGYVNGVMEIFHRTQLEPDQDWFDFLEALASQTAIAIDNATLFDELQRSNLELVLAYDTTLEGWAKALEIRDEETEGHCRRVTELTMRLAREMDIDKRELVNIRRGAMLHDIGKMGISDTILLKPGPLTDGEWEIMRQHPVYARDLVAAIPFLYPAIDIPYSHHEKWDGSGYPQGLHGNQIPLAARIFAIVDVWDALLSDRPYRKAWSEGKARQYILEQSGVHFDPAVVEAFLRIIE